MTGANGAQPIDDAEFRPVEAWAIAAQREETRECLTRIALAMHAGDVDGAVTVARQVPTEDRAAALAALEGISLFVPSEFVRPVDWTRVDERRQSTLAFWFAAAHLADDGATLARLLQRVWARVTLVDVDDVRAVLDLRPLVWRRQFGQALDVHGDGRIWRAARQLAADGLIAPPPEPGPLAILGLRWSQLPEANRADPLVGALLDRMWTTPEAGKLIGSTLSTTDASHALTIGANVPPDKSTHSDENWAGLLIAWGLTDPERRPAALDACLAAMAGANGDRPSDLRGWALVHGRLNIIDDEAAVRQVAYLALAAGGPPPAAAVARAVLARLLGAMLLDAEGLLDAAPDALLRAEKGAVREYLRLLDDAVRSEMLDATECVEAVRSVVDQLPRGVDSVARQLLGAWGAETPGLSRAVETWIPPAPVDLPEAGAVEPVTSVDDLVDLLLQVTHGPVDPIEVERAVDGMMRLRDPNPSAKAHLWRELHGAGGGQGQGLAVLVSGWLGFQPEHYRYGSRTNRLRVYDEAARPPGVQARYEPQPRGRTRSPDGEIHPHLIDSWVCEWDEVAWPSSHLLGARLAELEPLVGGSPVESLALPTHGDGGIDAATLLQRVQARVEAGRPPGVRELALGIQRTNPGEAPLLLAGGLPDPVARWLALLGREHAFHQAVTQRWQYVGEGRLPIGPLVLWQPIDDADLVDGAEPTDDPVRCWLDTRAVGGRWGTLYEAEIASVLLQLPWHPDVAAVHLQPTVVASNERPDADFTGLMKMLAARRVPLGPQSTDLLSWVGTYINPRARLAASEAIATAARHGILNGGELGRSVLRLTGPGAGPFLRAGFHLEPEPPKLTRIAATLADAARVDEHGERVVLDAVVACLPALRVMRSGVLLLEIGAEIAERRGVRVELPEPLSSLAAGRSTLRLAEEARRLSGTGRTAVTWDSVRSR